ncbi:MAG: response regulator [Proteobacteria bacterium]|nr:response regulator [Pseudomonadota bacterium]MBU4471449.1 response regulator [Pseudomonadota bacterium]MCG2752456.1 response regulator [Desulfobacteraceae bacterium]
MNVLKTTRILIVDDEIEQLRTMKLGLRSRRYEVNTARNSKEALQQLDEDGDGYEVVVTDYCMPGMSGLQFLKKVKTQYKDLAVIMMTAFGKKEEFIEVLDHPRSGFIEKPFSMDELVWEIERVRNLQT